MAASGAAVKCAPSGTARSADNAIGYTQASGLAGGASLADPYTSRVVDSLFVGETENIGNPKTDAEKAYGRSLPKPELPDFPIRGYEYYDTRHDVVNTTFRNFEDNATRKTGALSYLLFTSFGVSSNNAIEKVKFENAKPVYFPPMERKWANDNWQQVGLENRGDPRHGRFARRWSECLHSHQRRRERQHRNRPDGLRDQAHLERRGVQGRCRTPGVLARRWCSPGEAVVPAQVLVRRRSRCRSRAQHRCPGPGGRSWQAGPGARAGAAGAAPAQPPIVLSRNGRNYSRQRRAQRTSRYRDQGDHRTAERGPHADRKWTPARGWSSNCQGLLPQPRARSKPAWMRCVRPPKPRTSRTKTHCGSRWFQRRRCGPEVAALVAEPALQVSR